MPFTATSVKNGTTALVTLDGELDAQTADAFREEVERAVGWDSQRLILDMTKLSYLSSAGLRALVFARQKMADDTQVVLVGVSDDVEQTIRLVGFHHSVTFSDRLPE